MSESTPTCQIHKKYDEIKCTNPAWSGDPDGLCILHSTNRHKDLEEFKSMVLQKLRKKDYGFSKVFFIEKAFFPGRVFSNHADFRFAIFMDGANFAENIFEKEANFSGAIFEGEVDFKRAEFKNNVYFFQSAIERIKFDEAIFSEEGEINFEKVSLDYSSFSKTKFYKKVIFDNVHFTEEVGFSQSEFKGDIRFLYSTFYNEADYRFAKITGNLTFKSINNYDKVSKKERPFCADFSCIEIENLGVLRFQDLSLANVKFFNVDMTNLKFRNVTWRFHKKLLYGRNTVYDELLIDDPHNYNPPEARRYSMPHSLNEYMARVEEIYRQLKINFHQSGDYKNAGDFHYGEMEMHRKANFWRRRIPISWYNFYWALSGYGERPLRALGWLIVFLLGMAGLVWGLGLEVGNPPHIADFGDSFIYILQKVTLQRPTWAEPMGFWGKLVAGFSVLLLPGQAALFLLALRNRLGRRR